MPVSPAVSTTAAEESLPVTLAEQKRAEEDLPASPVGEETETVQKLPVSQAATPEQTERLPVTPTEMPAPAPKQSEKPAERTPRYTADMSVEDIAALMTCEEAREVKVDTGICNGWTIGRVADERTPSLKFYLYGYKGSNNVLRAAAKVMMDSLTEQKAG